MGLPENYKARVWPGAQQMSWGANPPCSWANSTLFFVLPLEHIVCVCALHVFLHSLCVMQARQFEVLLPAHLAGCAQVGEVVSVLAEVKVLETGAPNCQLPTV